MRLSVIVPVYNLEKLVGECVSSICATEAQDIEVICVNDGSTDGSASVLRGLSERDGRVKVINQEDLGVSNARNTGIEAACGEYLTFVDGDDRLASSGTDIMLDACARLGSDVIGFGASAFPPDLASDWLMQRLATTDSASVRFCPDMVLGKQASPFMWGRAYRRSLVVDRGIRFDEKLSLGEDVCWLASCLPLASSISTVADVVYEYRLAREGSLMTQQAKGSSRQIEKHLDVVASVYDTWDAYGLCERYATELADWAVRYAFYAAMRQPDEVRHQSAVRMRDTWKAHDVEGQLSLLPRPVRKMVELALSFDDEGRTGWSAGRQRAACLGWRVYEYGLLDLAETALGRGGSQSGSGA